MMRMWMMMIRIIMMMMMVKMMMNDTSNINQIQQAKAGVWTF